MVRGVAGDDVEEGANAHRGHARHAGAVECLVVEAVEPVKVLAADVAELVDEADVREVERGDPRVRSPGTTAL